MRYAQVTVRVTFEHDDSVPVEMAALRLATFLQHGDVLQVDAIDLRSLDPSEVMTAVGGCGQCPGCKATTEELATRAVMEGSPLGTFMGRADGAAITAEQDAITRAQQHTI